MDQQGNGPMAHALHMPTYAGHVDKAAGFTVGPIGSVMLPVQRGNHAGAIPESIAAARLEQDKVSVSGSGYANPYSGWLSPASEATVSR